MLIVLDNDGEIYLFASRSEAEGSLEAIDVENNEYEFCDCGGQKFIAEIISPVTTFRSGAFRLLPDGIPNAGLPFSFLAKARHLGKTCNGARTLEELKARIEHPLSQPAL